MSSQVLDHVLVNMAKVARGMTVLAMFEGDQGGPFALAKSILPSGHLTLIVRDPIQLASIAEQARPLGVTNLTLRLVQALELPFPDGAFDCVWCEISPSATSCLDHVLCEAHRVSKPGGLAVFVVLPPTKVDLFPPEKPDAFMTAMSNAGFSEIWEGAGRSVIGIRSIRFFDNADPFRTGLDASNAFAPPQKEKQS